MTSWRCTVIIGKSDGLSHEGRVTQDGAKNVQYWLKTCFVNWGSWSHQKLFMTCCQRWKDQRRQRTIIASHTLKFTFLVWVYTTLLHSVSSQYLYDSIVYILKINQKLFYVFLNHSIISYGCVQALYASSIILTNISFIVHSACSFCSVLDVLWVLHAVTTTQQEVHQSRPFRKMKTNHPHHPPLSFGFINRIFRDFGSGLGFFLPMITVLTNHMK